MKVRLTLIRCGKCGKRYSSPLGHVCVTRLDRKPRRGRKRIQFRASVKCGTCGRLVTNPLTHTCRKRSDYRRRLAAERKRRAAERRKAAAARRRAARPVKPKHDYRACRDADCARVACQAFRDGVAAGMELMQP